MGHDKMLSPFVYRGRLRCLNFKAHQGVLVRSHLTNTP